MLNLPTCSKSLLCKIGMHDMQRIAHWCDRECAIVIVEYECSRCGKEAWDCVHFDPDNAKVVTRIPVDMSPLDAAILANCGKVDCEIAKQASTGKKKAGSNGTVATKSAAEKSAGRSKRKAKEVKAEA